jgi:hypothetical protein
MSEKPELKQIGALEYQCTACEMKIEINAAKKLNAGQIKAHINKRFAQHLKQHHSEDFSQAAARIVREATERV